MPSIEANEAGRFIPASSYDESQIKVEESFSTLACYFLLFILRFADRGFLVLWMYLSR